MGPNRSLTNTIKESTKPAEYIRWLHTWSNKYDWVTRAQAYDDYIDKKREEKRKGNLDIAEQHAKLAMAFQQRVHSGFGDRPLELSQIGYSEMA